MGLVWVSVSDYGPDRRNVLCKGQGECPLLEHESVRGHIHRILPGITGEALKWNSGAPPPP